MPAIAAIGKLNAGIIGEFREIVGEQYIYLDEESLNKYGQDQTENLLFHVLSYNQISDKREDQSKC